MTQVIEPYFFQGVVIPISALTSMSFSLKGKHYVSGVDASIKVSIVLSQIAVWVESDHEWNIWDLRNLVKNVVRLQLSMVGYLKGYAYEFEITRVTNQEKGVDFVFGIAVDCLAEPRLGVDLESALVKLKQLAIGQSGLFLNRCFSDLSSAMSNAEDRGFYCYRAIESLRHHCAALHDLSISSKAIQWSKFREMSGCSELELQSLKIEADPLRHGEPSILSSGSLTADQMLTLTWGIVDRYISKVEPIGR